MTIKRNKELNLKRYKSREVEDYEKYNESQKRWMNYAEDISVDSIVQCIRVVQFLHKDYTTYHERVALQNVMDHLEGLLNS